MYIASAIAGQLWFLNGLVTVRVGSAQGSDAIVPERVAASRVLLLATGCGSTGTTAAEEQSNARVQTSEAHVNSDELIAKLRHAGRHETHAPATQADIEKTETTLGKGLPDSYKRFVSEFSNGAYLFEIQEVSAVGDGNPQIVAIQNIDRIEEGRPDEVIPFREGGETRYGNLVPFGLDANGNEWCFVIEGAPSGNEYAVAYLDTSGRRLYGKQSSFTAWLSILVEEQDEVIRTLYGDEVIYDELGLG
jgi:SMI1-KNR4 cell-wall